MTENTNPEKPLQSSGIRMMTPDEHDAHNIGVDLADAAFIHDLSTGMSPEKARERWSEAYMLGRNSVENAFGAPNPYAQDRISELRSRHNEPNSGR